VFANDNDLVTIANDQIYLFIVVKIDNSFVLDIVYNYTWFTLINNVRYYVY